MGREKQAAAVVVLFPTQQFVFRAWFNFKGCICFPAYTIPDNYPTISPSTEPTECQGKWSTTLVNSKLSKK